MVLKLPGLPEDVKDTCMIQYSPKLSRAFPDFGWGLSSYAVDGRHPILSLVGPFFLCRHKKLRTNRGLQEVAIMEIPHANATMGAFSPLFIFLLGGSASTYHHQPTYYKMKSLCR